MTTAWNNYFVPETIGEALQILQRYDGRARVVGGGAQLVHAGVIGVEPAGLGGKTQGGGRVAQGLGRLAAQEQPTVATVLLQPDLLVQLSGPPLGHIGHGLTQTAKIGRMLGRMIREGKVHAVTCTGANLEEDIFNLLAYEDYEIIHDWRCVFPTYF